MPNEAVLVSRGPDPVKLLLGRIPEFKSHLDKGDLDLPYVVYGFFAQYLLGLPAGDPVFDRGVSFINELAESGDRDLENLLQVSVFEALASDERCAAIKRRLRKKAKGLFRAAQETPGTM